MKKFCSKCGTQLDLGQKTCARCNAFNPYFITGFTSSNTEPVVEKQELPPNTSFTEQPAWQKETESEIENLRSGQLEQHKNELELKYQLNKVKEETEQLKKETFNLVKDVQKELHGIEQENKLLKEKVELLKAATPAQQVETPHIISTGGKTKSKKGAPAIAAILLLLVVTGVSYYFFSSNSHKPAANATGNTSVSDRPLTPGDNNRELATTSTKDSVPVKKLLAVATVPTTFKPVATATENAKILPVGTSKPSTDKFSLTETKLKTDLAGKKLSGCDITIKNSAEISSIGNLVLVDKLSASYLKYKCTLRVKQGNDVYTSTPYIYYSAEGTFIKVDGTNCE